ncbi:hypothetical protein BABINDRAFT_162690 [Babjeviella inositovora NRRL Y-12698]|uniref:Coatomer subunit epsilon n=1 Tax=Babjeviella inositovora NRRL Y-12698 TaxID=984486 RepID=A0A1E3QNB1_9ASCO|nr:uncharacterized protein BABINDRAFT_162690 [Babjeviella inositovora NRRL Y-12698]ODQ78477.1 hypothetical protein BABINDRAFT_162690 [Babjeviella inositovora NRRL Y-12698]
MDPFSDSGELYAIRQQFFAGQYSAVAELSLDEFSEPYYAAAKQYITRSQIALGDFKTALATLQTEDDLTSETLSAYIQYLQGNTAGGAKLEQLIAAHQDTEIVQIIGAIYLVKANADVDGAITLLSTSTESPSMESILLLLQLRILNHQLPLAAKELQQIKKLAQDSIIIQLAEALVNLSLGGEAELQQAYYFFEEISSQWLSFSNLLSLLAVNLQMNRLPESEETIKQLQLLLDTVEGAPRADFIANQITYALLTEAEDARVEELRAELALVDPQHPYLVDYAAKNLLFDDIVAKYEQAQV